jgi:hypothetical protein
MPSVVWGSAVSAAGAFAIIFAFPGPVSLWACGIPAVVAGLATAAGLESPRRRLTVVSCSVAPGAALCVVYWADLSEEGTYNVPLSALAATCLVLFTCAFCLIMALLPWVELATGSRRT